MPIAPRLPSHPKIGVPLFEARMQTEVSLVKAELLRLSPEAQQFATELAEVIGTGEKARNALAVLERELIALLEPDTAA